MAHGTLVIYMYFPYRTLIEQFEISNEITLIVLCRTKKFLVIIFSFTKFGQYNKHFCRNISLKYMVSDSSNKVNRKNK